MYKSHEKIKGENNDINLHQERKSDPTPFPRESSEFCNGEEKIIYQIRRFPDNGGINSENEQFDRTSVLNMPTSKESSAYITRRHSEVILNPSDVFQRDYFKFSKEALFGHYDVDGIFGNLNNDYQMDFLKIESRNSRSGLSTSSDKSEENKVTEDGIVKHYVNSLKALANGDEKMAFNDGNFIDLNGEVDSNSCGTPKNSLGRDTLLTVPESRFSSRRNSVMAEAQNSPEDENVVNSQKNICTEEGSSSLLIPIQRTAAKESMKSISRQISSNSESINRIRRKSMDLKNYPTQDDENLNRCRYCSNSDERKFRDYEYFENRLKADISAHSLPVHVAKCHVPSVNGDKQQERKISRVSVHLKNTESKDMEKDSYHKIRELEYTSSGGLLSNDPDSSKGATSPYWTKPPDNETLLFSDGKRRIDMVLVYEEEDYGVITEEEMLKRERRKIFSQNLEKEGLEFEIERKEKSFDAKTYFLKIHAPWNVMTRYAELMDIKMPIKRLKPYLVTNIMFDSKIISKAELEEGLVVDNTIDKSLSLVTIAVKPSGEEKPKASVPEDNKINRLINRIFDYDHTKIAEEPSFYKATYSQDREEQFVIKDRESFFTSAQRSQIVWQILMRAKYDSTEKAGIRRLLNDETYLAAFPLHEGNYEVEASNGFLFDRRLLYLEWARPSKWYKRQPLWLVRKYFGDKIALYFAWLGFYTYMLIVPSVIGVLCFLYGVCSLNSEDNVPSKEICDENGAGNITLCPMCDKACRYLKLGDSCMYAKITYLFDNPATVFFAIFMSFWATMYLELWKRQQSIIVWEWDLQFIENDEEPRPEFETSVKTFRINPVTREKEPYLPTWSRALRFFATSITVLCMIVIVLGAVLGTIIYRISLVAVIYSGGGNYLKDHAKIFTSMTAALINLIIIMILTKFYHQLAIWLTNVENPRTQTEYEDSYTFKIFLFEFVNFYSSLIYIAFFKGRFFMYPGDTDARSSEFLKLKGDVCDPAGCLSELCIQLAIIMIGKQCFNNILELLYPKFWNWWYHRIHHNNTKKDFKRKLTRWEEDYQMQDAGRLALFEEYLEMVLQYGFVTLFVAAFPLAPLFALLNNIGEIRLDAYKMVTQSRRPLAERVEDIGAWYGILKGLTYTAVVSNAFVIAYTSDFIPRMVYQFVYSPTNDLRGYIKSSLSEFNTSDYTDEMGSPDDDPDPPICYYRGYRNGPNHETKPYDLSPQYWHVFAARLAFVVVFEHIVFALTGVMAYVIPDVPSAIKTQMQRERLLAKEAKYEKGLRSYNNDEQLLSAIRDQNHSKLEEIFRRGSWGRRLSRNSSNYDTRLESSMKQRKMSGFTANLEEN